MPRRARRAAAVLTLLLLAMPLPAAGARPGPSGPTTVEFSGYTWTVKDYGRKIGPGPNFFSAANVNVAADGLHLRISKSGNRWSCAEVILNDSFGYGTYSWTIASAPDLDPNAVLGMFTWNDAPDYAHREIDIEFARWGNAADPTNGQYVVQPWDASGHLKRFTQPAGLTNTVHTFVWAPGEVRFVSRTASGAVIDSFTYVGADVPVPGGENARINLWLFRGSAPQGPQEVIISDFTYTP
ncbi:MAG TPA: glycoside hydrolase family 16 protein [Candidatus Limnocylindria bacterium]|nr:glycoside hydrolase family 16 protein [Candidatus Limnocylindria bacterium]